MSLPSRAAIHHRPTAIHRAAAAHCTSCRRELPTGQGTDLPFIGVVGPECLKKFTSLIAALEQVNGLKALEEDQGSVKLAHHVLWDLRRAGIAVEVVDVKAGVKALKIVGLSRKPGKVVESWEEMRAKFEQRLKVAAAERDAQDWVAA